MAKHFIGADRVQRFQLKGPKGGEKISVILSAYSMREKMEIDILDHSELFIHVGIKWPQRIYDLVRFLRNEVKKARLP